MCFTGYARKQKVTFLRFDESLIASGVVARIWRFLLSIRTVLFVVCERLANTIFRIDHGLTKGVTKGGGGVGAILPTFTATVSQTLRIVIIKSK